MALYFCRVYDISFRTIETGTADYSRMIDLRLEVLLRPIGIPRSYISEYKEKDDLLIGAFTSEALVGCCIITTLGPALAQLRQMAVALGFQQKQIGSAMVAYAESVAREARFTTLVLHARHNVIPFYQKCGYAVEGEPFFEVGIAHCKMKKALIH